MSGIVEIFEVTKIPLSSFYNGFVWARALWSFWPKGILSFSETLIDF